jgi:hypothetical protein
MSKDCSFCIFKDFNTTSLINQDKKQYRIDLLRRQVESNYEDPEESDIRNRAMMFF